MGIYTLIGARGGSFRGSERVLSRDSSPPNKETVRSEELPSPRGVTSLPSIALSALEEAVKEEEEAMSVLRSKRGVK